jgi:ABC-type sulfate/molybdate transport systems ATPase subunit
MSLVENMICKFDDFALEIPRWELLDQGVTALNGPSGSGKTTVLRVLAGLIPCVDFSWTFHGIDLAKLTLADRRIGIVFQTLELFPHLTARENIFFAARARKIPAPQAGEDFRRLVGDLRLEECESRNVRQLSGGERQRVALARALIGQPRVLLLDEPFSSLDIQLRDEARELVSSVIEKRRIPTILITHDARDLEVLADRVDEIRNGQLI